MTTPARRVLKDNDTLAVLGPGGDLAIGGSDGLYHQGTRYLSGCELLLNGRRPQLLTDGVDPDGHRLCADLSAVDAAGCDTLHVRRTVRLRDGACSIILRLTCYGARPITCTASLALDADFADLFEVRGFKRRQRGEQLPAATAGRQLTLACHGLDQVMRRTRLRFFPAPDAQADGGPVWRLELAPQQSVTLRILAVLDQSPVRPALRRDAPAEPACIETDHAGWNAWLQQSAADLRMLATRTPWGPYPCAGVPWFAVPFGRDGIITALQCLWLAPETARTVLAFLAACQARQIDPARAAEPGKILHEMRAGEMAALDEVPFGRYYGSVDATPLFIVLAGAWHRRTGDTDFLHRLWPAVRRALAWIDHYGDPDHDGFIEYAGHDGGLTNQCWKDSTDSVMHADGQPAAGPIAMCEVQGYVYAAWLEAAGMAQALGRHGLAQHLRRRATRLQQRFDATFWCEQTGTYALALDRDKQPCQVRASNAGHALWAGIARPERAPVVAQTLLGPASFSGWGIRTLAAGEARFNPLSYHNGSVWPHDNALIVAGLARYGCKPAAMRLINALCEAAGPGGRLPELFCGFDRRPGSGPAPWPASCSPQAWASGAVFLLLQTALGIDVRAALRQPLFDRPMLPQGVTEILIRDLQTTAGRIDVEARGRATDVRIRTWPARH